MKVKAMQRFQDLKEDKVREPGDVFACTKARFEELVEKLPGGYVELVEEDKRKAKEEAE